MNNYQLQIEYDGTNFVGWQSSKKRYFCSTNYRKTFQKILKKKIKIIGAGRTDKGVHARAQFANFKTEIKLKI